MKSKMSTGNMHMRGRWVDKSTYSNIRWVFRVGTFQYPISMSPDCPSRHLSA